MSDFKRKTNVSADKFGNPYTVVGCKGDDFPKGYVELGGKLYKIEPSTSNKEGVAMWVRITQVKKRPNVTM